MKRWFLVLVIVLFFPVSSFAKDTYRIEVLQVSKINPFDWAYEGFVNELARNGIVKGKNLVINRRIIDADADAGIWKKLGILMKIKNTTNDIIAAKPDLVLTISTPATKYSKDKLISAGIPVVFTAVAVPQAVGCASVTKAGPGFTGSSLYLDPTKAFKITKLAFPNVTKIGIVHSDDDNAIAFAQEAKAKAAALGITVLARQVGKSDSPKAAANELIAQGAQAFGVPIDAYYALRNYQPTLELMEVIAPKNIPAICYAHVGFSGAVLYVGSEFDQIGAYAGAQAARILKEGVKPETLPVLMQEDLKILVDVKTSRKLGIELPMGILQIAKSVESEKK
ncbi:MAG TPA: ABC transporter substrate binding protein [Deltaproteobacteria bacterium]|nr:ABC transporter substrate binding protein [Deltaproteobacteria bacterium]HOI06298.1 ABC transporter substrate binding protein [Deltaproteobacteria bacterium]